MTDRCSDVVVRHTEARDIEGIIELTKRVYVGSPPWTREQLRSHLRVFPEGQFVALDSGTGAIVGMAASLIVLWDNYSFDLNWRDFTAAGYFTNHDPARGRTLYGAEVMVDPDWQGCGVGSMLYDARRKLAVDRGLLRIRAGARLRHYHKHADRMSAEEYTQKVVSGELGDPTLTFQLRRGFKVIAVTRGYLRQDPESLGYAAVIEWINPAVAAAAGGQAVTP